MKVDQKLVDTAIAFIRQRYPDNAAWKGAAAMYTETGRILTSTYVEAPNEAASLCHETGAICEAHKLGERIVASVCVSRGEDGSFHILTPCGICQERLYVWGGDLEVAVPQPAEGGAPVWRSVKLSDIQPYYWRKPYMNE